MRTTWPDDFEVVKKDDGWAPFYNDCVQGCYATPIEAALEMHIQQALAKIARGIESIALKQGDDFLQHQINRDIPTRSGPAEPTVTSMIPDDMNPLISPSDVQAGSEPAQVEVGGGGEGIMSLVNDLDDWAVDNAETRTLYTKIWNEAIRQASEKVGAEEGVDYGISELLYHE